MEKLLNIESLLESLSIEEKAALLCGAKPMETKGLLEKDIPPLRMTDGPNGVRKVNDSRETGFDIGETLPSTSFPVGATLSCSWNKDLFKKIGEAIGKECLVYDVDILLGPAVNIKRNPLCGRNFEYLSEDPILAGVLGSEYVKGVQSTGVLATPKHYACNNNEKWRTVGNSIVDERALREIYLKPFEIITKEAKPGMIMTSYNLINGEYASQNKHLFDILKNEWGFDGVAMTDWGGIDNRVAALKVGQDLEMPGCQPENVQMIIDGYNNGEISIDVINESVSRILEAVNKTRNNPTTDKSIFDTHQELAINAANESLVLLKNINELLPLNKDKKYSIIGQYFEQPRFQGGGSSLINNARYIRPIDTFNEEGVNYIYSRGFNDNVDDPEIALEDEAVNNSKDADIILLFIGQSDYEESESYDRSSMKLPSNQLSLINRIKELNKPIVVVLFGGASTELPYEQDVDSILFVGLPGECSGVPIYQTLFGINNPSGKLSETWMKKYEDHITSKEFSKHIEELYKESIYVGYRYTETKNQEVMYPFGYGLSYTTFDYSDLEVSLNKDKNIVIKVKIKNVGRFVGQEIVQIYTSLKESQLYRPSKELKGFAKVKLEPNEEQVVSITIPYSYLEVYDVGQNKTIVENGTYTIMVGKNVRDIVLEKDIEILGEEVNNPSRNSYFDIDKVASISNEEFEEVLGYKIPEFKVYKKPYDMYTPICMMNSFFGKVVQNIFKREAMKIMIDADSVDYPLLKRRMKMNGYMSVYTVETACLRFMLYSSSGGLTNRQVEGILDMANGHPIRGYKKFKRR